MLGIVSSSTGVMATAIPGGTWTREEQTLPPDPPEEEDRIPPRLERTGLPAVAFCDRRMELIATPLSLPEHSTEELLRWAVFCAASVDYLCTRAALPCPSWVHDSRFAPLTEPWFHAPMAQKPSVRAYLLESTPEPFRRRNIYCGNRVFATKYDLAEQQHHLPVTRPPTTAPVSPS